MNIKKHIPNRRRPLLKDPWLEAYRGKIEWRAENIKQTEIRLTGGKQSLKDFAAGHEYFGLHFNNKHWVFREWAPNAQSIFLIGDFSEWRELPEYQLTRLQKNGVWEIILPKNALKHGQHYRLRLYWNGGWGDRLPAYARYVVQDSQSLEFTAKIWSPENPFEFKFTEPKEPVSPLIYEAHIGMASEQEKVASFAEFKETVLPRIAQSGYNTVQLMAILGHPYYGSFGYHVANFFSITSRFGTPDEFKALVDEAHRLGLRVVIDLIHSHAVRNEKEGLARFDGTRYQYFHSGARGEHTAWDSLCFNYEKPEVLHFLLSNCRFWLDEYRVDGFRFDGVTSMLYKHHGLGYAFTTYEDYFNDQVDEDAYVYLALANKIIHEIKPAALSVAEDVSGMPGLGAPQDEGGCGFDFRLAMGVSDFWFKLFDMRDEDWPMDMLWRELSNRRLDEQTISYLECHDQAIVGGQTAIFRMAGEAMYHSMHINAGNLAVQRAVALHKMARAASAAAAGNGYLNFMGNEFGHPEWVDFPREGNNWSHYYARRQWSLSEKKELYYFYLYEFDKALLRLIREYRLYDAFPQKIVTQNEDKILIFERNDLFFFFNFHPSKSFADYAVEVLPGTYQLLLDSDAGEFAGHGRVAAEQTFVTAKEQRDGAIRNILRLYLPSRTLLVLRRGK